MKGGERSNTDSKYRVAPDFAITHKENNGTPVQSQSERIGAPQKPNGFLGRGGAMERKSLAACGKPTIAESAPTTLQAMRAALSDRQLGWNSRGVSSLLTVWRLPCVKDALHFGVSRTNRDAPIIKPDNKAVIRTEILLMLSRP